MQHWATELLRDQFHPDIWIASLEAKLDQTNGNVVVTDCRFPNEIDAVRSRGGQIVWVRRDPLPEWYDEAVLNCQGLADSMHRRLDVHASEWSWTGTKFDHVIHNNGSVEALHQQVNQLLNACVRGLRQPMADPASERQPHSSNTLS
jgi:rhodanese-related sulfurtransferase